MAKVLNSLIFSSEGWKNWQKKWESLPLLHNSKI